MIEDVNQRVVLETSGNIHSLLNGTDRESHLIILNEFLEGERAGARVARKFASDARSPSLKSLLQRVVKDEAWCCAMLTKHIERLGGRPGRETGDFFEKAMGRKGERDRLTYLNRGQSWVTRRLTELLPGVSDRLLTRDLRKMLRIHERNASRCRKLGHL